MDQPTRPFRYKLTPLLRRDEWERDRIGGELRRVRVLADQAHRRLQAALAQVGAAEARMRELHRDDQPIALESRQLLHEFLEHAHVSAAARLSEWKHANGVLERVRSEFESKQLAVRTLERHRDRQQQQHHAEQARQAQRGADDDWLAREGRQ